MRIAAAILAAVALSACAVSRPVSVLPDGNLRVYHQGATGGASTAAIRDAAMNAAVAHCAERGEQFELVSRQEGQPPFVLGRFPYTYVVFRCVARDGA